MNRNKYLKIIALALPVMFLFSVILKLGIAPVRTLDKMEQSSTTSEVDTTYLLTSYDSLLKEYAFKNALLELASEDSIQLILNLPDSQAILTIHGVPLLTAHLDYISVDPFLKKISSRLYTTTFSVPQVISAIQSTIVKEPIVERQAPKDTLEAALNAYMPDTLIQHPAFVKLTLVNNINVFMEQASDKKWSTKRTIWAFKAQQKFIRFRELIWSTLTFQPYEYEPVIRIVLATDDLRSIYRALPNKNILVIIRY